MRVVNHVVAPVRAQAVQAIRAEIISGRLAPGQRLIERELCEELGISRNTLREAYRQLEAEGFLDIPPHKGPTVARLTGRGAGEIYELREALECLAVRLFVDRASSTALAELKEATAGLREAHRSGDVPTMLEAKTAFYDVIYAGAGNDMLRAQAALLQERLAGLRAMSLSRNGRPEESLTEIEEVVERILAHDRDSAASRWRDHIRNAAASALQPDSAAHE